MKRIGKLLSAATAALVLLGTTGCDTIRDYSVNSYQGVLPISDFRPSGSTAPTAMNEETPKPSVPSAPPTAAPAAGESGSNTTKPGDSSTK